MRMLGKWTMIEPTHTVLHYTVEKISMHNQDVMVVVS